MAQVALEAPHIMIIKQVFIKVLGRSRKLQMEKNEEHKIHLSLLMQIQSSQA